jgi:hypothetical protein
MLFIILEIYYTLKLTFINLYKKLVGIIIKYYL